MDKISCDICMDLIPLVKDGIASEDSCDAVTKHISKCEKCKVEFDEIKEKKKINNEDIKSKTIEILLALMFILNASFNYIFTIISLLNSL